MSKTLRRPMFRGGPVNSRGTGITSGLDDSGYMNGGRVEFRRGGYSTIPGIDDLSQIGIYNPYSSFSPSNITPKQRLQETLDKQGGYSLMAGPRQTDPYFGKEMERREFLSSRFEPNQEALRMTRSKPFEISDESFPPRKAMEEPNKVGTGTGKGDIDLDEEITKQAKLYEKLLGGEEARSQSIYDALLAAAPGFFKGKNLREAAPQVLESINKSGAFDKPRDIRQAAAQLAIQRRMLIDKGTAEEKQRLAILSAKGQKDVFDVLKDQQIPIGNFLGSYEAANREGGPGVLINKYYLTKDNVLVRIDKDKAGQPIPTPLSRI